MENEKYLSNKLRKAIEDSGFTDDILAGIYDTIENMDDEELKEYIYTNAQYLKQNIPMAVNDIPELKTLVNVEPNWGVENHEFSKLFGNEDVTEEEFLRNFDNVPYSTVKYVAEQHGMDPKKLEKAIREKQLRQTREDIANGYGEGVGGKIASFITRTMFPNMVEGAVKEGRDPTLGEMAVDIGSNMLYAVPWSKLVTGTGKVGKIAANVVANTIAPATSEGLDVMLGDNDKTAAERLSNIGVGTLINAATPYVLNRYGRTPVRWFGGETESKLNKLGLKSADEIVTEQINKEQQTLNKTKKAFNNYVKHGGDEGALTIDEKALLFGEDNLEDILRTANNPYENAIRDIASKQGKRFNDKLAKANKQTKEMYKKMSENEKAEFRQRFEDEWKDTYRTVSIPGAKTSLASYATNKAGDLLYADRPESIPMVGPGLSKLGIVESKKEKERQERIKQRKINKENATKLYKGNYTREMLNDALMQRQWDAGFKPNKKGTPEWESYTKWYLNKYGEMPKEDF